MFHIPQITIVLRKCIQLLLNEGTKCLTNVSSETSAGGFDTTDKCTQALILSKRLSSARERSNLTLMANKHTVEIELLL